MEGELILSTALVPNMSCLSISQPPVIGKPVFLQNGSLISGYFIYLVWITVKSIAYYFVGIEYFWCLIVLIHILQKVNEKAQVINDYEAGRGIPNQMVIGKIERVLGVKLRGKDRGKPLTTPGTKKWISGEGNYFLSYTVLMKEQWQRQ